jgi:hypothetical protein
MSDRPPLFVEAVIDGLVVVSARGRDGRRTARRLGCRRTGSGSLLEGDPLGRSARTGARVHA